ncbi:Uncharacterized [Moorella glycerini]|jgi:hypothetical protein|uniref:Uncharacterized protein n=1 Tax=Neomoorella stamsii TaxID=1266720 RepID=A0A9X7J0F3_9FIRM|nr:MULTISPECIES: hypothetical protein [Moorella]PRR69629.1 hypothetical protein MOST_30510 [Moorella stamsii]CEP67847.1 Uncharacterized [Moorella glycerini]
MKAFKIKGTAMMAVGRYEISLNGKDIREIIKDALQPTDKEIELYEKIPVNVVIQIEPIKTNLEIEHIGEPRLMESFELEMKKVS